MIIIEQTLHKIHITTLCFTKKQETLFLIIFHYCIPFEITLCAHYKNITSPCYYSTLWNLNIKNDPISTASTVGYFSIWYFINACKKNFTYLLHIIFTLSSVWTNKILRNTPLAMAVKQMLEIIGEMRHI